MNKLLTVGEIEKLLKSEIPMELAESWDNVGLLVGDRDREVRRVLVALDATDSVIDEAIDNYIDLIVTHHPVIFGGLKSITKDKCGNIYRLIEKGISVFSAHTNFDKLEVGTSAVLADKLCLKNTEVLSSNGFGRIGELENPILFDTYICIIKNILGLDYVNVVGEMKKPIKKVAVCGGSGSEFLEVAFRKGADLYISGDVTYHNAQRARELGINWVDATHYASENISMKNLKEIVDKVVEGTDIYVELSTIYDQPFRCV